MSVALSAAPERKLAAPLIAFALLVLGGLFLFNAVSARQAILFIVGGALGLTLYLSLIHISEPTRPVCSSRMPSSA